MFNLLNRCKVIIVITAVFCILPVEILAKSGFIAYNARTPRTEAPVSHDYHISGGISGVIPFSTLVAKHERENGEIYRGIRVETMKSPGLGNDPLNLLSGIHGTLRIDEARSVNEVYVYKDILDFFTVFQIRISNRWQDWEYRGVTLGAKLDLSIGRTATGISYDTNFDDLHLLIVDYAVRFDFLSGYIAPKYQLRSSEAGKYFEAGIEIGRSL